MIHSQHEFFIIYTIEVYNGFHLFFNVPLYTGEKVRTIRFRSFRSVTRRDAVAPLVFPLSWLPRVVLTQVRRFSCTLVDDRRSATVTRRHLDGPPTNQRHDHVALIVTNGERYTRRHLSPATRTRLSHVSRKKTYATHAFPPDRRLVAVALSLIYNPHPRVVDGRFIRDRVCV